MKIKTALLCALLPAFAALAQPHPNPADPLAEKLFPPELILHGHSEIGLTDAQREAVEGEMKKFQERVPAMQEQMQKDSAALAALIGRERVDTAAALAQFDKLTARERDLKRAHLELMLRLKNQLTPQQQAKLHEVKDEIKKQMTDTGPRLHAKMEKVQAGVQRWADSGRDPSPIGEIMQELEPLMREGKIKEAEAVLDRALKELGGTDKGEK